MSTPRVLPAPDPVALTAAAEALTERGVRLIGGSFVNSAGIVLGKTVSPARLGAFASSGLGVSPTWNVFCIDGGIAFTPDLGVVGDLRLRLDLDALTELDGGLAWAPTELFDQAGEPLPIDPRGTLRRVQADVEAAGLDVLVGHELEFVVTAGDGEAWPRRGWTPYGFGPVLDHEAFLADLVGEATAAGLGLEQLHAEYVPGQFEFSLPPLSPLAAADAAVLSRLLVSRIARRHGLLASFSPFPFAGGGGNGAHLHFSFSRDGAPLFSGGDGPYGITTEGGAAIGGLVEALPGIHAVLSGSILSGARLRPGFWSGAFACWGRENREAAIRFLEATPGNPHGANIEVKPIDPSANPYLASAAVLGAALQGVRAGTALPAEVPVNPVDVADERGIVRMPSELAPALDALEASASAALVLGEPVVAAVLAVRRWELDHHGDVPAEELPARFRFAWSI
ncbi:glutamine synthetase family protein [Amnibacterium sp. CER49]|uniref:glutamine synthetase family protein n=1 Tax=Amnibacterium sp. CER49 TaxID=3039161 RepID=UPI0024495F94|nr:glutamine synthetase family protein [Amnibacterium sp. CER49]MDH2444490.1 glutamine synthetase family protein [Amnibacterium sp. CER49]